MRDLELMVFFDESGKNTDRPTLMGAISIPKKIYHRTEINELSKSIHQTKLHWKNYSGDSKEKRLIAEMIRRITKFESTIKFNVINYDQSIIAQNSLVENEQKDLAELTVYTKFPERIIYGLLRRYGKYVQLNARIFIEEANEYKKYKLNEKIQEQLNVQSLYRGESFKVLSSEFKTKGQEVGLELTDILLGITRTIIKNEEFRPNNRGRREKTALILELLKHDTFYSLLKKVKYYEWSSAQELTEVDFNNYLQSFLSTNHELWFS